MKDTFAKLLHLLPFLYNTVYGRSSCESESKSGTSVTESALGAACYRFKLRRALNVVSTSGSAYTSPNAGDYVYTRGATAGESNPANM